MSAFGTSPRARRCPGSRLLQYRLPRRWELTGWDLRPQPDRHLGPGDTPRVARLRAGNPAGRAIATVPRRPDARRPTAARMCCTSGSWPGSEGSIRPGGRHADRSTCPGLHARRQHLPDGQRRSHRPPLGPLGRAEPEDLPAPGRRADGLAGLDRWPETRRRHSLNTRLTSGASPGRRIGRRYGELESIRPARRLVRGGRSVVREMDGNGEIYGWDIGCSRVREVERLPEITASPSSETPVTARAWGCSSMGAGEPRSSEGGAGSMSSTWQPGKTSIGIRGLSPRRLDGSAHPGHRRLQDGPGHPAGRPGRSEPDFHDGPGNTSRDDRPARRTGRQGNDHDRCAGIRSLGLAFAPDGKTLAATTGWETGRIRFYDVASGKETRTIDTPSLRSPALAYTPDGSRLVSGMADGSILVWDVSPRP